ncbi:receptor-like protein Cf-9 isoform X1 [Lycium ferocissimum]|uniref:receptor-like protein Cf-9 isoform X1 n=1 Tax=Lycium ferocissimum TaxID=112874 RepID=UPI0028165FEE|nr:receptor-like protein Cf-9 isoform X1 [Lycium ferocissimum]
MGYGIFALFLLYIAFLCQLVFSSSLPHLCPNDQALALLQFKHMFTINSNASNFCIDSINGQINSYPKTLSWNKSTDCCSWDGVYCEETTGQVIELNLTCSQLQGKFHSNSSLFQLSNLKRLDLSYNDFYGSLISPKFGEFSSLTHLDLSGLDFTGLIPSEISHLSKLYVLRIWNFFTHELRIEPHNFELLLKNLTQLRELNLNFVNISSTIPLNFSSFLTTLCLSDTQLFGILPERVFHLSNLEYLDLSPNPQLTVWFPTTKWNSSISLMYLYLGEVNFTGEIPDSFSYLTSLQRLIMISSNLTGPFPKPIWNLTSIKWLYLGGNNLNGQIECLSCNQSWTQLTHLDFSSNSLTGLIPSYIFSLPSLYVLNLSNNSFTGKIHGFKSKILGSVELKHNQLQGPIPKSLLNQQSLEYLLLSQNNLSGKIDSTICNLKTVKVLDLGSNNLKGTIPQCLGEMSELETFDLRNNSLSGTINTTFRFGNRLIGFNLRRNKLEGEVPRSLINCKHLEVVDLGNNELNDTFPKWLGTLPNLEILSLRSNKFHGHIKYSKNKNLFVQLRILDLSSNEFSGNLSACLFENFHAMKIIVENTQGYAQELYYSLTITTKGLDLNFVRALMSPNIVINLSRNRFEGHIPRIIGDLVGLRSLNLSHNDLEGHIPASLQQLSVLESLDLSSNKIGGEIPQQLASLTSLEVLNLSHNHLVGCIPRGKQFNTFDYSSYQGNVGLRGFPLSRDCGGDDGATQVTTPIELDQEEEGDSAMISWQAVLMGYGCGLIVVLSIIYIMLATQNPAWFSRMVEELEHRIITRMQKHKKRN